MTTHTGKVTVIAAALLLLTAAVAAAQGANPSRNGYTEPARIDRYLDVEIWPNHQEGDYYVGDNIWINFRVNRDAFVAIYSVDTRGRVNLLFPASPGDDNFAYGGITYTIPGPDDDYDLVIAGPEGVENIQAIASRERFPIPDWYPHSGLECDWDDRHDFMDYLNGRYFVDYGGQRFAYDRTAIYINQWEPEYFRPVYYPRYPSWTVCGNVYIDYPWGGTIYVDGVYWGCAPMYVPRIWVGWHTITVYDPWGWCWESDIHISRFHTVVLDRTVVVPRAEVRSKYKEVRRSAHRDPVTNGYPKFRQKEERVFRAAGVTASKKVSRTYVDKVETYVAPTKKYTRGTTKLTKTSRGYESASVTGSSYRKTSTRGDRFEKSVRKGTSSGSGYDRKTSKTRSYDYGSSRSGYGDSRKKGGSSGSKTFQGTSRKSSGSSGSYRKKSEPGYKKPSDAGRKTSIGSGKTTKKGSGSTPRKSGGSSKGSYKPSTKVKPSPPASPPKSGGGKSSGGSRGKKGR